MVKLPHQLQINVFQLKQKWMQKFEFIYLYLRHISDRFIAYQICTLQYGWMNRLLGHFQRYFNATGKTVLAGLQLKTDKYNGIHVTPKENIQAAAFNQYMSDLLRSSQTDGTTSVWVHLTGQQLSLVSDLVNVHNFGFHRGAGKTISLYRWLLQSRKDMVVPYSMFHVGCGGVIINQGNILLIEEKRGDLKGRFGVPGGRADFGQGIQQCSEREVFEQIGVKSTFSNVLWLRELSSYVYGSYDYYFACLMKASPQALKQMKICDYQIQKTVWIPLKQYRSFAQANSFGTQLEMALYISDLYDQGYDFANPPKNYSFMNYRSPVDRKERFFGHHRFAGRW